MEIDKKCPYCGSKIEYFKGGEKCVNTPMHIVIEAYLDSSIFKRDIPAEKTGQCSYVKFDKKELWKDTGDSRLGMLLGDRKPIVRKNIEKALDEQKNEKKRALGEILVEEGIFNEECIERALKVQEKIRKSK